MRIKKDERCDVFCNNTSQFILACANRIGDVFS